MAALTVVSGRFFTINVPEAIRQEYRLARQHMSEVREFLDYRRDDHVERYLDAQDRLNRARELLLRG